MHPTSALAALAAALSITLASSSALAGELNSAAQCAVGMRVQTKDGHKGKITRVDRAWSYCYVLQDDTRKEVGYLYSLLIVEDADGARPGAASGGAKADAGAGLRLGSYTCWVGSSAAASGLRVTSASAYESDGGKGKYRVEQSGKIVFESGPFAGMNAARLSGQRVGLNLSGGTFFNMSCDPPK